MMATRPCPSLDVGWEFPWSRVPRSRRVIPPRPARTTNQEIAEDLVVALNTVKKYVAHILTKLGAANRTEATARARELGLLP